MNNIKAISLAEQENIDLTYKGLSVDATPYGNDKIALINVSEPNVKHLSDYFVAVVSTSTFIKTTLTKNGKF